MFVKNTCNKTIIQIIHAQTLRHQSVSLRVTLYKILRNVFFLKVKLNSESSYFTTQKNKSYCETKNYSACSDAYFSFLAARSNCFNFFQFPYALLNT